MLRPIVHIGYHKTASTWFQRAYYPNVRNARYVRRRFVRKALLNPGGLDFSPERARRDLELSSPDEPVILCEESLSGYLHNGGLHGFFSLEMARRLHATLPSARIVVFIRSQPEMLAACYQQYIRGGGTYIANRYLNPGEFVDSASARAYKIPRFEFEHFAYLPLVRHYESLFGRDSVHVIPYEEFRRDPKDLLERCASQLGLEIDLATVSLERRNESFSLPVLRVARFLNRFTYRTVNDKQYWIDVPNWYTRRGKILAFLNKRQRFGPPPSPMALFGGKQLRAIEDHYRESNRRLADHTGLPLAELGYPI